MPECASVYRNRSHLPSASNCTSPPPFFKTTPDSAPSLSARAERKHCANRSIQATPHPRWTVPATQSPCPSTKTCSPAVDIGGGLFTPNGDGINDALYISFDVLKVIDARPIGAHVFDLHGRLVRTLNEAPGVAGHYKLSWDGRRDTGALANPGLYLFHLQIAGDSTTRTLVRSIGLSY